MSEETKERGKALREVKLVASEALDLNERVTQSCSEFGAGWGLFPRDPC